MSTKQVLVTDEGLKKLEQELEQLKTVTRKDIAEKIKVALSFGDLSENSEYDEAKNEQAIVESKIAQLEQMLKNVKVIDESDINTEVVNIGSKVKVFDKEFNEEIWFRIVGSTEIDPMNGKISDESPIGRALLSAKVGDVVDAETPDGSVSSYKVLEIAR